MEQEENKTEYVTYEEFKKMDIKTMRKVILTFCFIPIINTILTIHYIKHGVF